jgi:2-hydroxy-6-oxonona-2,4-dienedioate hydrolase
MKSKQITFSRVLKRIVVIIIGLFVLLSIIPYILPLKTLPGEPFEPAFANSQFAEIDDLKIHYRLWGEAGGSAGKVLLLHGFSGSTFSWRYSAPELEAKGYQVIAVDLPGFGLSERSVTFVPTADNRASLIWNLLETIDPGAKWHLAGHSMGGSVVVAMVLQRPEQAKSLILAAGAIPGTAGTRPSWLFRYPPVARAVRHLATRVLLSEDNVLKALASAYGRAPDRDAFEGYYRPLLIRETDAVLVTMLQTRDNSLFDQLEDLDLPTLLIWGEEDAWVPLTEGQELLSVLPSSRLITLPEQGHCPMETAPTEFNLNLIEFLAWAGNRN